MSGQDFAPLPSVLSRWFVAFREDIIAGRVSLEELIEVTDVDMQSECVDLCPACGRHPLRDQYGKPSSRGVCGVCWLHQLRDAHLERIAVIEARREMNAAKKELERIRAAEGLLPERPKRGKDYANRVRLVREREEYDRATGTIPPTETPVGTPLHECTVCGFTWHSNRPSNGLCTECGERAERRRIARAEHRPDGE